MRRVQLFQTYLDLKFLELHLNNSHLSKVDLAAVTKAIIIQYVVLFFKFKLLDVRKMNHSAIEGREREFEIIVVKPRIILSLVSQIYLISSWMFPNSFEITL